MKLSFSTTFDSTGHPMHRVKNMAAQIQEAMKDALLKNGIYSDVEVKIE